MPVSHLDSHRHARNTSDPEASVLHVTMGDSTGLHAGHDTSSLVGAFCAAYLKVRPGVNRVAIWRPDADVLC